MAILRRKNVPKAIKLGGGGGGLGLNGTAIKQIFIDTVLSPNVNNIHSIDDINIMWRRNNGNVNM